MNIKVKLIKLHPDAQIPTYATSGSVGLDLKSLNVDKVWPQNRAEISTGIAIELPEGYEAQVRPRSGLAIKNGITVLNAPGTIDSDYRGEIRVILYNTDPDKPFYVTKGMKIAQLVIAPISRAEIEEVEFLGETDRGTGGFGSTGD